MKEEYVAWRVVPLKKGIQGEVFTDKEEAVQAAVKLDGENWLIEGLTYERYIRL